MYDVIIIGGGLGGLSLSIQLAKQGLAVALFEKKKYPFHKVCGEYISMESWGFLSRLGLPLEELGLPKINNLNISAPSGFVVKTTLELGGFGISRYTLDKLLADIAIDNGVDVFDGVSVTDISDNNDLKEVKTSAGRYEGKIIVGSFGKRSNLDAVLNRKHFRQQQSNKHSKNYIGVKYHVKADLPTDLIELHNFSDGYCGISKIEEDRYCMCYLTTADNLKKSGGSIEQMEHDIVSKNPFLKKYFLEYPRLYEKPLSISQINFSDKKMIENDVVMLGDSAGLITPLCGNGMSMALHASYLLAPLIVDALRGQFSKNDLFTTYEKVWKKNFKTRIMVGRVFQQLFGDPFLTDIVLKSLALSPPLVSKLVRLTHGKPF